MPMYNLIEYIDNYSDTSGSLWGFKKDDLANSANVTKDDNALMIMMIFHLNIKQVVLVIQKTMEQKVE